MKIGDVIETGIWVTGEESPEMRTRYEKDVTEAMDYFCSEYGYTHGQVEFIEKHPFDDRIPEVPDHVYGPRVRLLAVECEITGLKIKTTQGSFVENLDKKDLMKLQSIIQNEAIKNKRPIPNKYECDQIIEQIGPEAALDAMRRTH